MSHPARPRLRRGDGGADPVGPGASARRGRTGRSSGGDLVAAREPDSAPGPHGLERALEPGDAGRETGRGGGLAGGGEANQVEDLDGEAQPFERYVAYGLGFHERRSEERRVGK